MEIMKWRRSSYTGANGGNCVEVATAPGTVPVRDSKHPERGHLSLSPAAGKALARAIKAGKLDV